jgi:hypothetical protein
VSADEWRHVTDEEIDAIHSSDSYELDSLKMRRHAPGEEVDLP